MSNKDLKLNPHQVAQKHKHFTQDAWWYEVPAGIALYVKGVQESGTAHIEIPWGVLRRALARKDKS